MRTFEITADDGRQWITRAERFTLSGNDHEFLIGPGTYRTANGDPFTLDAETWVARYPSDLVAKVTDVTHNP